MEHGTLTKYLWGYGLSLLCTLAAFGLVLWHLKTFHNVPPHATLIPALVALALAQFIVQCVCFLHLGSGPNRAWNAAVFSFALIVVCILVGGSLWIMANLQSNNMVPFDNGVITPQAEQD